MVLTKKQWNEYWQTYQNVNQIEVFGTRDLRLMHNLERKMSLGQSLALEDLMDYRENMDEYQPELSEKLYWNRFWAYQKQISKELSKVKVKKHKRVK